MKSFILMATTAEVRGTILILLIGSVGIVCIYSVVSKTAKYMVKFILNPLALKLSKFPIRVQLAYMLLLAVVAFIIMIILEVSLS